MSLHKNLTGIELHAIYAFTYADADARNTATGLTSLDIGKVAKQTDTNSFWILIDTIPTWSELTRTTADQILGRITVGKSGPVSFNTIKDAVAYVIAQSPSSTNPWTIVIYPGIYIENNPIIIPTGVIIETSSGESETSTIVEPFDPLDDLFILQGGSLSGLNLNGVSDPLKSTIRLNITNQISSISACSITNCSNGIIIENGAIGIISRLIGRVLTINSEINNVVYVDGYGSKAFITGAGFNVPSIILPFYSINPINTCIHVVNGAMADIVGSTFQVTAKNANQISILSENSNSLIRILGCNFDGGNIAVKISASSIDAIVSIQASTIFNYTTNFVIEENTGAIFQEIATDSIKNNLVIGSTLTGSVDVINNKSTDFSGAVNYQFETTRRTPLSSFIFDRSSSGLRTGGGAVTKVSGLNVHVTDGYGWVRRDSEVDVTNVSWAASSFLLAANSANFIFYNGQTLSISSNTVGTNSNNIQLATVFTDGYNVRFIHNTSNLVVNTDALFHNYLLATRKFALNTGLAGSQGSSATKISVDAGSYYITTTLINFDGYADAYFSYFYNNNTVEVASQSTLDITKYDNGGILTTMTDGYYRVDTIYLTSDGRISLIYGTIQYGTALLAAGAPKAVAPAFIEPSGLSITNVVVQKNVGINAFIDLRPRPGEVGSAGGASSGVTDHGLLSGLSDDDHPQYLLVSGVRSMSGDLNIGGNSVVNVNLVDGVDVSAHGLRHNPGQIDAISTAAPVVVLVGAAAAEGSAASVARSDHQHGVGAGTPVTISTANAAGSASTVARSDHVHAHGALGGGATHALAIPDPAGSAGFISSADQQKLNGIASGATNNPLSSTIPVNVNKSAASAGVATESSRQDHKHNIDTAVVLTIAGANSEGTATTLARSDHVHAHGALGGGATHALVVADPGGTAGFMSPSDKQKLDGVASGATNTPLTNAAPVNVTKAAAAVGVSTEAARQDHKHDITTAVVGTINIGDAAAEGTATSLARSDHVHALTAPAAPANVDVTAAAAGSATIVARSDHKHNVNVGTPVAIGTANAAGSATTLVRSDHVHRGTLLQTVFAEITTDTTTTSLTFVTLISQSVTTTGGDLIINFTTSASNTNANQSITFRITVDATSKRGTNSRTVTGNIAQSAAIITKVTGLSAAAHTVIIEWKVSANTGQIRPATGAVDVEHASLIISEVTL